MQGARILRTSCTLLAAAGAGALRAIHAQSGPRSSPTRGGENLQLPYGGNYATMGPVEPLTP
jgi:hypothetical protein